jgi:hypothetical protein
MLMDYNIQTLDKRAIIFSVSWAEENKCKGKEMKHGHWPLLLSGFLATNFSVSESALGLFYDW